MYQSVQLWCRLHTKLYSCNVTESSNILYVQIQYYTGIKIYNCLPLKIKELSGKIKYFKRSLKKFLSHGSFYTMEEFLDWTSILDLNTLYL